MTIKELTKLWQQLRRRYKVWYAPVREAAEDERRSVYREQLKKYNPRTAMYPVREATLDLFTTTDADGRANVRGIVYENRYAAHVIFEYIFECAECLQTPEDGWILRSGLIALALENHANGDFRNTGYAVTMLGDSAIRAGVEIEPIVREVLPFCPPVRSGYMSVTPSIQNFAKQAQRAHKSVEADKWEDFWSPGRGKVL